MLEKDYTELSDSLDYKSFDPFKADDLYLDVKRILGDKETSLAGARGHTLTCVAEPKCATAGQRIGDQATHMNKTSATKIAEVIYKEEKSERKSWEGVAEVRIEAKHNGAQ